jgi:protein-S-isoprenylcysteine O-methyltransferase Ste14
MNLEPSHLLFLAGTAIYLTVRSIFKRRTSAQTKAVNKTSTGDRLLILLVGTAQVGLPLMLVLTPWLNAANYTLPSICMWLGLPTMAGALWLFWRAHADLGNSWSVSPELNANHQLVTRGVYRVVRHRMYASFFALGISQALLLNNGFVGWAALVAVSVLYWVRVPNEERMMIEAFGPEYLSYMQRSGGVLPRLGNLT